MIEKLRHRIDIKEFVATGKDTHGKPTGDWQVLYQDVPASIDQLSGRELERARQLVPTATHMVKMRYHPNLTVKHRIYFGQRYFDIGNIQNKEERNFWLEILAYEN